MLLELALLAASGCARAEPEEGDWSWTNVRVPRLGECAATLVSGADTVEWRATYPSPRVVLAERGTSRTVRYEQVYENGMYYWLEVAPLSLDWSDAARQTPLRELPDFRVWKGRHELRGEGLLRGVVRWDLTSRTVGRERLVDCARWASEEGAFRTTGVVPRIAMEQRIRGAWTPLTKYCISTYHFHPAPELRVRADLLSVECTEDSIKLFPCPAKEKSRWVLRPEQDGGCVSRGIAVQILSAALQVGERREFAFPIRHVHFWEGWRLVPCLSDWVSQYYPWWHPGEAYREPLGIAATVSFNKGTALPPPEAYDRSSERHSILLSRWPLEVSVDEVSALPASDDGYPGDWDLPDWAVERMRDWGKWDASDDARRAALRASDGGTQE
jgi:hypothetical protein